MNTDLGRALRDITGEAEHAVRAVDVPGVRSRVRRRRTQGVVARSGGALAAVAAVVVSVSLLGGGRAPAPADPVVPAPTTSASTATPSPTEMLAQPTTPVPGWVAGAAPCGAVADEVEVEDPRSELQGGLVIGTFDPVTAGFHADPAGDVLLDAVTPTVEVPGTGGVGTPDVTTTLVGADGTVAFWDDPARVRPQVEATDGNGGSSLSSLFDAVDCRTGRPLTGAYRAFAHDARGPETVELAPVVFGPGGSLPGDQFRELMPVCGEPAPALLLTGGVGADLTVTLGDGVTLDGVLAAGVHVPVTVTGNGPGRLRGRVPQAVRAVLVDDQGVVVTQAISSMAFLGRFDSAATFDVTAGDSFPADLYQWLSSCPMPNTWGSTAPGAYDLYVYDVILAEDAAGVAKPRTAVGGPFPITLR